MTATFGQAARDHGATNRIVKLTGLFWAFSYALLAVRGSILFDDWGRLLETHRALTVTVGAGAYALALKQIDAGIRITLRSSLVWIAAATVAVMVARVILDELMFDVPQGIGLNLLWSLSWSAYFGLWVMGSLAFAPAGSANAAAPAPAAQSSMNAPQQSAEAFDLLAEAILAEAASLKAADRSKLAARILELGGYEGVEATAADNDRARLAIRIAARLSAES